MGSIEGWNNAYDAMIHGVAVLDAQANFVHFNPAFSHMLGYSLIELQSKSYQACLAAKYPELDAQLKDLCGGKISHVQSECCLLHQKKYPIWAKAHFNLFKEKNKSYLLLQLEEITPQKNLENRLTFLLNHDLLTGLANRSLLENHLTALLQKPTSAENKIAIFFIGLDRLRLVNKEFGRAVGDSVLQQLAQRISKHLSKDDFLARIGGTEFVAVIEGAFNLEDIKHLANKLVNEFQEAFHILHEEVLNTISLGIAIAPDHGASSKILIKNASLTMDEIKEKGGNNFAFFDAEMPAIMKGRIDIETALHHALRNQELILYYQPKVDLKTKKMTGVEALIRWQRQGRGLILPAEFIPIAEKIGLIEPITEWVLYQACDQLKKWQSLGFKEFTVSVNISPISFKDTRLLEMATRVFSETQVDPNLIEFEITETGLMQNIEIAEKIVNSLKQLGVKIAIDDFGTGYSSFSYLRRFSVDSLKIDRTFITEIPNRVSDMAIVTAIIAMSRVFGVRTVAEGTETPAQIAFLMENDCDEIQGYYFCKPAMADEITHLLITDVSLSVA